VLVEVSAMRPAILAHGPRRLVVRGSGPRRR